MKTLSVVKLELKKTLSRRRYQHCLNVADLSASLGKKYGWSPESAYRAGLLHDCAKEWSPAHLRSYVKRHRLQIPGLDFIFTYAPNLAHGYVGAAWAKERGWLNDRRALSAIKSHTLGRVGMSREETILYIADFASVDRTYGSAADVRKLAFQNLRAALRLAMSKKIKHSLKASKPVHPYAVTVWNWFLT